MQVYLDGKPLAIVGQTLSHAIKAALKSAGDRMIIEAMADGQVVPPEHLESPPGQAPYAGEVRFRSADRASLARVASHDAADTLEQVRSIQRAAADHVRSGQVDVALRALGGALEGWSQVRSAIELMSGSGMLVMPGEAGSSEKALEAQLQELAVSLSELKRSIAQSDWSALGDVLAFDLEDRAVRTGEWLRTVAQQNSERDDGDARRK